MKITRTALGALMAFVLFASTSNAQMAADKSKVQPKEAKPRSMNTSREAKAPTVYADSNEFKTAFRELLPLVRPKTTLQERAQKQFQSVSRSFAAREIDSMKAYNAVMAALDSKMEEQVLFDAYRAQFTATEVKELAKFYATSAGKKLLENDEKLAAARDNQIDGYVRKTITSAITPLGKPRERTVKLDGPNGGANGGPARRERPAGMERPADNPQSK